MADFSISPNMLLPIPNVGVAPGPDYANDINNCLTILDQHTHAPGSGVQITPAAININTALSMNSNDLVSAGALTLSPRVSIPANGSVYESGVDLFYVDGNGVQIRITQSGSVTGSPGTITGLPSGTASASFGAGTFVFQAATATGANVDGASFILRNNTANSKALTLSPPNAMGANFSLTLPSLPGSTSFLQLDTSGNITAAIPISNANLPGNSVQAGGLNIVVSSTNATTSLKIIRGYVRGSDGAILSGEGFSVVHSSAGVYNITWSVAFADTPVVVTNQGWTGSPGFSNFQSPSSAGVAINTTTAAASLQDRDFSFIAIGQR